MPETRPSSVALKNLGVQFTEGRGGVIIPFPVVSADIFRSVDQPTGAVRVFFDRFLGLNGVELVNLTGTPASGYGIRYSQPTEREATVGIPGNENKPQVLVMRTRLDAIDLWGSAEKDVTRIRDRVSVYPSAGTAGPLETFLSATSSKVHSSEPFWSSDRAADEKRMPPVDVTLKDEDNLRNLRTEVEVEEALTKFVDLIS